MPDAAQPSKPIVFTMDGLQRGALRILPLCAGIFVYGIAFGVLSREQGLSALTAAIMSGAVYSGTAQIAALQALSTGAGALAVMATILVINARYVLYGAALRPWLGETKPWQAYTTLFFLVDHNWIVGMKDHADGERDGAYLLGSGAVSCLFWIAGTLAGSILGQLIANPAKLGLDFFLVGFSAAMGVGMFRGKSDLWTVGAAALAATLANGFLPGGWSMAVAGIAGAMTAYVRYDAAV